MYVFYAASMSHVTLHPLQVACARGMDLVAVNVEMIAAVTGEEFVAVAPVRAVAKFVVYVRNVARKFLVVTVVCHLSPQ